MNYPLLEYGQILPKTAMPKKQDTKVYTDDSIYVKFWANCDGN